MPHVSMMTTWCTRCSGVFSLLSRIDKCSNARHSFSCVLLHRIRAIVGVGCMVSCCLLSSAMPALRCFLCAHARHDSGHNHIFGKPWPPRHNCWSDPSGGSAFGIARDCLWVSTQQRHPDEH